MSDTKSAQLRVADGYVRLVVDAGGRSWSVAVDHATGGAAIGWGWSVTSLDGEDVLLAGAEPTWAAAVRKAFRAAERAALEAASVRRAQLTEEALTLARAAVASPESRLFGAGVRRR